MDVIRAAVFAVVFIVCATFALGGLDFATPYDYSYTRTVEFPTTMCTAVEATPGTGCYDEGVRMCKLLNSGHCFQQCERDVRNTCDSRVKLPAYTLPRGFEDAFSTEERCISFVGEVCGERTFRPQDLEQCEVRGRMRCSLIGRLKV